MNNVFLVIPQLLPYDIPLYPFTLIYTASHTVLRIVNLLHPIYHRQQWDILVHICVAPVLPQHVLLSWCDF